MKISVAKSSGFCFGVRRAIDISMSLAGSREKVYVLGDIVHNSFVVRRLAKSGIKKLTRIGPADKSVLIISAHGAPAAVLQKARSSGYSIVDATCPKVKSIYKIAKELEKDNDMIIIGDKGHAEVRGIAGQLKKRPITIGSAKEIPYKRLGRIKKAAVITQSTQSLENIESIMSRLEKVIPYIKLYNTTCKTTAIKQKELVSITKENDVVLIVGSSTSANTKRLYEIAGKINPRTHWINSVLEIKTSWFKSAKNVGIMAGASTPDEIVRDIVKALEII